MPFLKKETFFGGADDPRIVVIVTDDYNGLNTRSAEVTEAKLEAIVEFSEPPMDENWTVQDNILIFGAAMTSATIRDRLGEEWEITNAARLPAEGQKIVADYVMAHFPAGRVGTIKHVFCAWKPPTVRR